MTSILQHFRYHHCFPFLFLFLFPFLCVEFFWVIIALILLQLYLTSSLVLQASFLTKKLNLNGKRVELAIWVSCLLIWLLLSFSFFFSSHPPKLFTSWLQDTAGQERFHALGPIYYRDSNGALLVFDITDEDSFQKVIGIAPELLLGMKPRTRKKQWIDGVALFCRFKSGWRSSARCWVLTSQFWLLETRLIWRRTGTSLWKTRKSRILSFLKSSIFSSSSSLFLPCSLALLRFPTGKKKEDLKGILIFFLFFFFFF